MSPPPIFDRAARALRRDRAFAMPDRFLADAMADEVLERVDAVTRRFEIALVLGAEPTLLAGLAARGVAVTVVEPAPRRAAAAGAIRADADAQHVADGSCDLVVSANLLDTVDDLPGAMVLARRALRPDGLLVAIFAGGPSLSRLRAATIEADGSAVRARHHPAIDVRTGGELLTRAGFALPVADAVTLDCSYAHLDALVRDLRAAALTNQLRDRAPVSRAWRVRARAAFAPGNARVHETLRLIALTGWAPAASQPQPARRGSATASLAAALKPPR